MRTTTKPIRLVAAAAAALLLAAGTPAAEAGSARKELKVKHKRELIDATARETMDELLGKDAKAKVLYEKAYGYAVFSNLKLALGVSGGGGNGVAVEVATGRRTYMKMGTVGVGLGLGGQRYRVVFLFQDESTYRKFVDKGWEADASAQAVAGDEGANAKTDFRNGLAIYQLTDKGLMASVDIAGTKYWKNKKLNRLE